MPAPLKSVIQSPDEDFDTGVYRIEGPREQDLTEIERRARAALAGSPGVPGDVAWARLEQRWLRRA